MNVIGRAALPEGWSSDRLDVTCWKIEFRDPGLRASTAQAVEALLTADVLKNLPPDFEPEGDIEAWMRARVVESAVYSVRASGDGALLGLMLVAEAGQTKGRADVHLGYLFGEAAWGKGYATEVMTGFLAALNARGRWRLLGGVARDNPASARVLEKVGFHRDARLSTGETEMFVRVVG